MDRVRDVLSSMGENVAAEAAEADGGVEVGAGSGWVFWLVSAIVAGVALYLIYTKWGKKSEADKEE